MMKPTLLLLALLLGLYGSHVAHSPLVYQDAQLVRGTTYPFTGASLVRPRGLSGDSWRLVQSPHASHALNIALHIIVSGLVGVLLWRLTADVFMTWATITIMAVHPLTGETVAYAASRAELIAAIGVLLALVSVTGYGWNGLGAVPALLLGVLGKETAIVGLALIPLVLWYQHRYAAAKWTAIGVGFLALSALPLLGYYAKIGEYDGLHTDAVTWVGIQTVAVWRLVVLSAAPLWLSVSPDVSMASGWSSTAALVLLVGSLETAWRARHRIPLLTLGMVGCALVAAPRFLVRTPGSPFNEHQWYLAMPFVACVIVAGLQAVVRLERFVRNYATVGAPHLLGLPSAWDKETA